MAGDLQDVLPDFWHEVLGGGARVFPSEKTEEPFFRPGWQEWPPSVARVHLRLTTTGQHTGLPLCPASTAVFNHDVCVCLSLPAP